MSMPSAQVSCVECARTFAADDVMLFGESAVCADCKPVFLQRLREGGVVAQTLHYASFGKRFLAIFLDGILLYLASTAVQFVLGVTRPGIGATGTQVVFNLSALISVSLAFLYQVPMLKFYGATLGKMALGVKVVTADNGPISWGLSIARYFCAHWLEIFTLWIGYLIAAFDDQHRTLHDRICGTRVIDTR